MGGHKVSLYWPMKRLIGKSLIYASQVGKHPSPFNKVGWCLSLYMQKHRKAPDLLPILSLNSDLV